MKRERRFKQIESSDLDDSCSSSSMPPTRVQSRTKLKSYKIAPSKRDLYKIMQEKIKLKEAARKQLVGQDDSVSVMTDDDHDESISDICCDRTCDRMPRVMENQDQEKLIKRGKRLFIASKDKRLRVKELCAKLDRLKNKHAQSNRENEDDDHDESISNICYDRTCDRMPHVMESQDEEGLIKRGKRIASKDKRSRAEEVEENCTSSGVYNATTSDRLKLKQGKYSERKQALAQECENLQKLQLDDSLNECVQVYVQVDRPNKRAQRNRENEFEEAMRTINNLKMENASYLQTIVCFEEEFKISEENLHHERQEKTAMQEIIDNLEQEKNSLAEDVIELEQQYEVCKKNLREIQEEKKVMLENIDHLQEEKNSETEKIVELKQQFKIFEENLHHERQQEKTAMRERIDNLEEEKNSLAENIVDLEQQVEQASKSSKRKYTNLRKIEDDLGSRIHQLEEQDVRREADLVALIRQRDEANAERDAARTDVNHLQTYNDVLQVLVTGLQTRLQAFEGHIQNNQDLRNEILQIIDGLQFFQPPPRLSIGDLQDVGQVIQLLPGPETIIALRVEQDVHVPD